MITDYASWSETHKTTGLKNIEEQNHGKYGNHFTWLDFALLLVQLRCDPLTGIRGQSKQ